HVAERLHGNWAEIDAHERLQIRIVVIEGGDFATEARFARLPLIADLVGRKFFRFIRCELRVGERDTGEEATALLAARDAPIDERVVRHMPIEAKPPRPELIVDARVRKRKLAR